MTTQWNFLPGWNDLSKRYLNNNYWYSNIQDFNPDDYISDYDTSRLVNPLNFGKPWISNTNGIGRGRYNPSPQLSTELVRSIEETPYYIQFTNDLSSNPNLAQAFYRLTDNLLPDGSLARIYGLNNLLRSRWNTTNNDALGRLGYTFNNPIDYIRYERKDLIPGARHNVFPKKGKRYFYKDVNGIKHWVNPQEALLYLVSETPTQTLDGITQWEDYEILGNKKYLTSPYTSTDGPRLPSSEEVSARLGEIVKKILKTLVKPKHGEYGLNIDKLKEAGAKIFGNPNLYSLGRLAGNLYNNEKVYDEQLKGINPDLKLSYNTYRLVVGDEATKLAYYRRAAYGQSLAAKPITSDADRQMAYQFEAKRIGDELREKGDLADNAEIRRTSDESNLHQWANTQRATEVANANNASINQANALRHNLLSQKHSAQWSSIDNYLKEIEYRKRQQLAEDLALEDLIYALQSSRRTPEYQAAYKKYYDILQKHKNEDGTYNLADDEVIKAGNEWNDFLIQLKIKLARELRDRRRQNTIFAKSGTKIVHKKKDDLLYKSTKDVVEHFRKMSKLSSDALNRKKPKIEKLASHPKGTKKYQQGGIAPFTVYTPVSMGGETTRSSGDTSKTSTKDNEGKETLDLVKSLFKEVLGKGLPVDVNSIYSKMNNLFSLYKAFGTEMDTNDIALLYLLSMLQVNNAMHSKEVYDKAKAYATLNDSLDEFAVNALGHFIVQDTETGKLSTEKSWKDVLSSGKNPITNQQLLNLRAYSPDLISLKGDTIIENVINNGMGINKIGNLIKALAGNIGSYEGKIEGLTQVESNRVKSGLLLLANAPDGYYKYTIEDKNLKTQMKAAISYITNMLSPSLRAILDAHGGADKLIPLFLSSLEDFTHNVSILPLTGKASSKDNSKEGSEGLKLDAATALVTGKGYKTEIELNPGSNYAVKALGRFSEFQKKSGENMGAGTTMLEATESTIKGNLDWNKATIGGSKIIPTAYNQVILNNGEVAGVDLPVDPSNPDTPDFEMLKQLENLDKLLKLNNIEDSELNWKKVNEICDKIGIPHKYDSTGKLNLTLWKRFAAFLVTTPDTALVNKNVILDMVGIASKEERDLYNNFILNKTNNKNFELSDTFLGFGHRDELYKGTVFVPIKENIVASAISSGLNIYMNLATDLELREQGYDPSKVKSYKKSEYSL